MSRRSSPSRASRVLIAVAAAALVLVAGGQARAQQGVPVTLRAQYFRYDPQTKILVAEGDVVIVYQDVTIRAQRLVANLETGQVRATGDVSVEVAGQRIAGEALEYNLFTRRATMLNAASELTGEQIVGSVHVRAERVDGIPDEFLTIQGAQATTCDLPNPDYLLTAREITYYVGDKIVFRDVTLWIAGRKIYTVPYFVVFLRERRRTQPLPTVGYNDVEGFFIHAVANYFLGNRDYGFIYLDLMTRLGGGIGIEHLYTRGQSQGSVLAYSLRNFVTQGYDNRARLIHSQPLFGGQVRLYLDRLISEGQFITPVRSLFASADGWWSSPNSSTIAYLQRSTLDAFGVGHTVADSARLLHSRRLSSSLTLDASVDAFQFAASGQPVDREIFPRLVLRYTHPRALVTLTADARLDPDANLLDARYTLEHLPELTVAFAPIPIGATLSLATRVAAGYLRETVPLFFGPPLLNQAFRLDAQATLTGGLALGPRTNLFAYTFGRVAAYSTGDALLLAGGRLDLTHQVSDALSARTGYTFRISRGRSPFLFDQTFGDASFLDLSLAYQRGTLLVTASTYYDFLSHAPGDLQMQAQYLRGADLGVVLAATYSIQYRQLSQIAAIVDWRINERWRVQYQGSFYPPTRTLYNDQISVVYTKGCWAAALTYQGLYRTIWLEAWITAFPYSRGVIGFGPQGPLFPVPYFQSPQGPPATASQGGATCAGSRS